MSTTEYEPLYFFDKNGRLRVMQHSTSFDKRVMRELSRLRESEEKRKQAQLTLRHILNHIEDMDEDYDCSPRVYILLQSMLESIALD